MLAVAAWHLGNLDEACKRAEAAVTGGMPPPVAEAEGLQESNAVAVLALFARARQRAIARAYREKTPWPPEWLTDVNAAYSVLVKHPLGTDEHVAAHFDFLRWLGASTRAAACSRRDSPSQTRGCSDRLVRGSEPKKVAALPRRPPPSAWQGGTPRQPRWFAGCS